QRFQDRGVERATEHGAGKDHGARRVRCAPPRLPCPQRYRDPVRRPGPGIQPRRQLPVAPGRYDVVHQPAARPGLPVPGRPLASVPGGYPAPTISRGTVFARQNPWTNGSIKGLLTGQYSGNTLLASDLFSIGGYGSVRGFQPAESTGNSGLQTSIELGQTLW